MEKRYYCFLCDEELSDKNSSNEHILLNALGGRLHSRSLLCKRCNSMIGNRFDDELARELNFAASYLNVPRQRGLNQIIRTEENEKYDLLPGGKPVLKRPQITTEITEGKGKVEIVSRSKAEAKEIIRGLSKKYPGINAEEALQQMMVKKEYLGRKVRFTTAFHAREIYPSIIKSAVEYYLYSGGATSTIAHLKPMILGRGNVEECCKYYYPVQDYFAMKDEEINHVLYVKGSHDEKVLYGFVSYFGVIQCLVLLNDHYDGPDMENSYVYNVMTTDSRPEKTQYDLSRDAVLNVIQTSYHDSFLQMYEYVKRFLQRAERCGMHHQWEKFIRTAWDGTIGQYPEGTRITGAMMREFTEAFSSIVSPWLAAHLVHDEN